MVARRSAMGRLARRGAVVVAKLRGLGIGARDERGVSAIEFSLVAPVLIIMFMGLCDLCSAVMTKLHVDRASAGTGDVVSTYAALTTDNMINMFTVASEFLQPYSATPLNVRITSVYAAQNGNAQVYWSCALNPYTGTNSALPALAANSVVTAATTQTGTLPTFFLFTGSAAAYNSSFIMVDIKYGFSSPSNYIIKTTSIMSSTAYMQPRQGLYIGFPWSGGSTVPPAPNSTTTPSTMTLTNGATCNYMQ